ncbi:long-chain fatty acid transport protein [Gammaproteobacteria bacterium]
MAGAGAAIGLDALSAGVNPASMALTPDRLDLGLALFFPDRGFTADTVPSSQNCPPTGPNQPGCIPPGEYKSKNPLFMIPSFGWSKSLDTESTIGISIGGNGGMNTEYDSAVFRNYANPANPKTVPTGATGIDLSQMFIGGTYTRKTTGNQWVGITPVIGIQNLKVKGLEPFTSMSESPDSVTGQGYDWSYGYGLRLGWLGQFSDQWNLGASYQTRIYMSKFEKYKGLLAERASSPMAAPAPAIPLLLVPKPNDQYPPVAKTGAGIIKGIATTTAASGRTIFINSSSRKIPEPLAWGDVKQLPNYLDE